jgi:hypothetical protein
MPRTLPAGALRGWLVPLLLLLLTGACIIWGNTLAAHGRFDVRDNLIFEADCRRVIENTTDLDGPQDRARIHPLHVLLFAPLGTLLKHWLSPELSTVVLTAIAAAWVLRNIYAVLSEHLQLDGVTLFCLSLIAGISASQLVFTMAPDTHILSALGLSGLATGLAPDRLSRLRACTSLRAWSREGGAITLAWVAFSVGMLGTNIVLGALALFFQVPGQRVLRRVLFSGAGATVVLIGVLGLHLAQRKVWPAHPRPLTDPSQTAQIDARRTTNRRASTNLSQAGAQEEAETTQPAEVDPSLDVSGSPIVRYAKTTWHHNSRFMTPPSKLAERSEQAAYAIFGTTFFAPHIEFKRQRWAKTEMASFEPWALRLRLPAMLGLCSWWLSLGTGLVQIVRTKRPQPMGALLGFVVGTIGYYALVVALYGDELFLYSPNWMFAVVVLAGLGFRSLVSSPLTSRIARALLLCATVCIGVNSVLFVRELLHHFT